jgi:glycine cleavage system regulatory protein
MREVGEVEGGDFRVYRLDWLGSLLGMDTLLIITISGPDRAGLVEQLADEIAGNGGNWEHSRMTHLGDRFVGLLQVRVAGDRQQDMETAIRAIPDLDVLIAHAEGETVAVVSECAFELELTGSDHPGIVRDVFGALAGAGANVESLRTESGKAAESGGLLFTARARLSAPRGLDIEGLRASLEAIAQDVMVDIELKGEH